METWTNSINQANKMALLAWTKETGIDLVQINGQRKYGGPPPGWEGDPPPSGTEVFIGKLPQDLYENVLIPLFQRVGRLYEFRLMLTFSGLNRGFAYARYSDQRGARRAIAAFHNFQLQQGCSIVVCKSTEKRELSLEGLGGWVSPGELEARLRELTQGVLSVTLHASPRQPRGQLAVLKYSSHRAAALAKKTLMEGEGELAEPGPEAEAAVIPEEAIVHPGAGGQAPGCPQASPPVPADAQRPGEPQHPVPEAVPGDPPLPHQVCPGQPQRVAAVLVPGGDPGVSCTLQWLHLGPAGGARQEGTREGQGGSGTLRSPGARRPPDIGDCCVPTTSGT
ncbi:dead end protein homolog 1 isoform X3 [Heliangelus exortis]|uniref:dead end protein homolog 1 isoform X3 n=1 Tax=Heliangelus exortis TaxID=472823 RepID=UPI003A90D720